MSFCNWAARALRRFLRALSWAIRVASCLIAAASIFCMIASLLTLATTAEAVRNGAEPGAMSLDIGIAGEVFDLIGRLKH
jgi:hypothetical protein